MHSFHHALLAVVIVLFACMPSNVSSQGPPVMHGIIWEADPTRVVDTTSTQLQDTFTSPTAGDCAVSCRRNIQCKAFHFGVTTCKLFREPTYKFEVGNTLISGEPRTWNANPDSFVADTGSTITVSSVYGCLSHCEQSSCVAWKYHHETEECQLTFQTPSSTGLFGPEPDMLHKEFGFPRSSDVIRAVLGQGYYFADDGQSTFNLQSNAAASCSQTEGSLASIWTESDLRAVKELFAAEAPSSSGVPEVSNPRHYVYI